MNNNAYKTPPAPSGSKSHLSRVDSGWNPNAAPTDEKPPKRKLPKWIWAVIAIAVLGIAVACFFLFSGGKGEASGEEMIVYGLENPVLFENEECAFVIDSVGEKGDYLELDVRCVNKTENVLSFGWESTCVNGSMFDPLWSVLVQPGATMKSSITFPLRTLNSLKLLPADQIKFVLRVHNESRFNELLLGSSIHTIPVSDLEEGKNYGSYKQVKGYSSFLFDKSVAVDKNGRPYYVDEDKNNIYFDEIYDRNGQPMYPRDADIGSTLSFYNDRFGRPYYFNGSADTVYYEGYGYAFYDMENNKYYFYDENGTPAYYGNSGIPEYYEGTVTQSMLDAEKPGSLTTAEGCYLVHKEFTIYPTGKNAEELVRPERASSGSEIVYWDGEKGNFILLGGEMDTYKGYIVHTFVENNSDSYIYFGWNNVVVNGIGTAPDTITVLRPHSTAYRDIIIPAEELKEHKINTVTEIDFRVYAVGENLSVPLYPIEWAATSSYRLK